MSYTNKLDQNRSAILINAGERMLKSSTLNKQSFVNSQISHNLLQQIDDEDQYQEIQNYQTQYIDDKGNSINNVPLQQKIILQNKSQQNQNSQKIEENLQSSQILSKQQIRKNKHFDEQKQVNNHKKQQKNNTDNNEFDQMYSTLKQSKKRYKNSFQPKIFQRSKKNMEKNKRQQGPSYITNAYGLKEQDFYKIDYLKKQDKNKNPYKSLTNKSIIKNDQLDEIEDIISEIQGLNKQSQQNIQNPIAKILPKDDVLGKSSLKYKKTKNMLSFGRQGDRQEKNRDLLSKLDDMLFNYRFQEKASEQTPNIAKDKNKSQNESKFWEGQASAVRNRQKNQKRRIKQSFRPIQNEFYNGNQFESQRLSGDRQKQTKKIQQQRTNNSKLKKSQTLDKLLQDIMIVVANWQDLPVIPSKFSKAFDQLDSYPNHQSFKQIISKIKGKVKHFSIFNPILKEVGLKFKQKGSQKQKTYQLMNEEQFATQWEKIFQQKQLKQDFVQQQRQILMEFDLEWYQTIVKKCFGKQLQEITQQSQQNLDLAPYIQFLNQIHETDKELEEINVKKLVIRNKLKYIDSHINSKPQFAGKCVIIIIPNIISPNQSQTDPQYIQFLKQELKDNHIGGIYYFKNSQNLCILSTSNQNRYKVVQDNNQNSRSVKINDLVVLNLNNDKLEDIPKQQIGSENNPKKVVEILLKIVNDKRTDQLLMKSINHSDYEIAEKQLKVQQKTVFGQIYGLGSLVIR